MLQVPAFVHKLIKPFVWTIPNNEKSIYLTFDDGPHPDVTPNILQILDCYDAKATFFCVGENVKRYPELFEEIKRRGHSVGNHTYNHIQGFKTNKNEYVENVEKADKLIQSKLFRPPHGRIKWGQARKLATKYQLIMWSLLSYDYDVKKSSNKSVEEVKRKSKAGAIVVFHDSLKAKNNVEAALPEVLDFWKKEDYQVKAIKQ